MSQNTDNTRVTRRTEDGDTNDEQQHPGTHTPLAEPLDPAERSKRDNGRNVADSRRVTLPDAKA